MAQVAAAAAAVTRRTPVLGTTTPSLSDAYGVSCRARAERDRATPEVRRFAPGRGHAPWVPRSPAAGASGNSAGSYGGGQCTTPTRPDVANDEASGRLTRRERFAPDASVDHLRHSAMPHQGGLRRPSRISVDLRYWLASAHVARRDRAGRRARRRWPWRGASTSPSQPIAQ